jgi:hypothetical protein
MARVAQTTAFREKWGGVISPSYTEGADLSSNKFVGTATTQDIINTLINPPKSNRYVGSSQNLTTYLKERNWTPETAPTNWTAPEKQTVLRAQIASLSETLTQAPPSKRPRPVLTHSVNLNSNAVEIVDPETPDLNVITNDIKSPGAEMNPAKSATKKANEMLIDTFLFNENQMAFYAILMGAGISGYYLMTRLGKKRGRK